MSNKCPVCKRARCQWAKLKLYPEKLSTDELNRVVNHNLAYIEMVFKNNQGSAAAEERMIGLLTPYCDELEKRERREKRLK